MKIKIGELAKQTGSHVVTLRYYEKEGLLTPPDRGGNNYRMYSGEDVERVKFIRHCRKHGMTLAEIRELLAYLDNPKADCVWVSDLFDIHIENVARQIQSLLHLKSTLQDLRHRCSGGGTGDSCEILKSLGDAGLCGCEHKTQEQAQAEPA